MIPLGVLASANVPASGGMFDPISGVGWQHAYWAEGPEFAAQGYGDGDGVSLWPDEVGSVNFTQATSGNRPLYKPALTVMNGQPSVLPNGTSQYLASTTMDLSNSSIVYIGQIVHSWTTHWILDTANSAYINYRAPSGNRTVTIATFTSTLSSATNAYPSTAAYLMTGVYLGASSAIELNGTSVASGNAGDGRINAVVYMFSRRDQSAYSPSPAAFIGFYPGDVRSDPGWADFEAWAFDHYGLT